MQTDTTPEKKSEEEPLFATPSVVSRLIESTTPGILKKVNSPSTAERKRFRVHFNSDDGSDVDTLSRNERLSFGMPLQPHTPRKGETSRRPLFEEKSSVTSPSNPLRLAPSTPILSNPDSALYPALFNCEDSVIKIIGKLLPIANTGTLTLRKSLKAKGILTIGDLARLPRKEVIGLHIKRPRLASARHALAEYAMRMVHNAENDSECTDNNILNEFSIAETIDQDKLIEDMEGKQCLNPEIQNCEDTSGQDIVHTESGKIDGNPEGSMELLGESMTDLTTVAEVVNSNKMADESLKECSNFVTEELSRLHAISGSLSIDQAVNLQKNALITMKNQVFEAVENLWVFNKRIDKLLGC